VTVTTGKAHTDDSWSVECPRCAEIMEFTGFFDPEDEYVCKCGERFLCNVIYFGDGSYIGGSDC